MSGRTIGILLHPNEKAETIAEAVAVAEACGYETWTTTLRPAEAVAEHAEGTELLVTVGGDGTFLFGARLAAPRDIPVLGINRGRLGFLTDVEINHLAGAIEAFAQGRTLRQRRSLVEVEVDAGDGSPAQQTLALNDVAVKSRGVNVVRLRVEADAELFGEFDADGVVVSTATGSTAYALSAGGPPIDPRVRAIAVVPVAPHAVITRPIVLPEMTVVVITVRRGTVFVAADGQGRGTLGDGGVVTVRAGPELSVVRFPDSPSFLRRLRDKVRFGLPLKDLEHAPGHDDDAAGGTPGARPGSHPSPPDLEAHP